MPTKSLELPVAQARMGDRQLKLLTKNEETNRQTERLVRSRKTAPGNVGPRRNEHTRNRCGSWPTCQFRQDDGSRDEANTSEESKEAVQLGRQPHIANSRMQIAPIAKTNEASDSMCTQSIPAMAASVG